MRTSDTIKKNLIYLIIEVLSVTFRIHMRGRKKLKEIKESPPKKKEKNLDRWENGNLQLRKL